MDSDYISARRQHAPAAPADPIASVMAAVDRAAHEAWKGGDHGRYQETRRKVADEVAEAIAQAVVTALEGIPCHLRSCALVPKYPDKFSLCPRCTSLAAYQAKRRSAEGAT